MFGHEGCAEEDDGEEEEEMHEVVEPSLDRCHQQRHPRVHADEQDEPQGEEDQEEGCKEILGVLPGPGSPISMLCTLLSACATAS